MRIKTNHHTSPIKRPIQRIVLEVESFVQTAVADAFAFTKAKEFFRTHPKDQEVLIDFPLRDSMILIDRNHPEVL
jgi:hypothetical protein